MINFYESDAYFITILFFLIIILYLVRKDIYQIFFGYGVPFVPTWDKKVDIFINNLELKNWINFLDLGSGNGKILEAVEKKYKEQFGSLDWITLTGIENSPYPYWLSIQRKEEKKLHYEIKKMDFFKENFSKYDVIYSYMITYLMHKMWKKIKKECKKWTIFYSNSFKIPWEKEIKKIQTHKKSFIYVYKV